MFSQTIFPARGTLGQPFTERAASTRLAVVTHPIPLPSEYSASWASRMYSRGASFCRGVMLWEERMKAKLVGSLFAVAMSAFAAPAQKARVFITESGAAQASGDAAVGNAKGSLAFAGGESPQSVEVMKAFLRSCPAVIVTA